MRKDDVGKLDYSLLADMPHALAAVARVMQWATTEKTPTPYERGSWMSVPDADRRYYAAEERHQAEINHERALTGLSGGEKDAESGLLHLAHRACSVLMRLELALRKGEGG